MAGGPDHVHIGRQDRGATVWLLQPPGLGDWNGESSSPRSPSKPPLPGCPIPKAQHQTMSLPPEAQPFSRRVTGPHHCEERHSLSCQRGITRPYPPLDILSLPHSLINGYWVCPAWAGAHENFRAGADRPSSWETVTSMDYRPGTSAKENNDDS